MKEYIFIYGVFRDWSKSLLGEVKFCGKTSIKAKMYKVNEFYPGCILGKKGEVFGDVYLIDTSVLESLDEFEGHEYTRKRVHTKSDIDCWIYEYKYDVSGFDEIKGGDWILR